ncbi:hypothetical protein ACLSZW_02215 [Avibacterium avium]|uniref:hypothetical protein n=1 Tax=Avibacterium avium TaxID=751 RepID=UPI003BF7C4E6
MVEDIHISTTSNEFKDICTLLKKTIEIINNPARSFTYHFNNCSILSNSAIAIIGATSNLIEKLYEKKITDFLSSQDFIVHIHEAVMAILESEESKKLLSKKIQEKINLNPNISINKITKEVIVNQINSILSSPNSFRPLLSNYINQKVERSGVLFNVESMTNQLKGQLIHCNFLSHFVSDFESPYPEGKYIGFRVHKNNNESDTEKIINHIKNEWLTDDRVKLSPRLKEDVVSRIFEIYQNAFGHGIKNVEPPRNVISCGDYDEKNDTISLCVVDLGGGICKNVMGYLSKAPHLKPLISDNASAIRWALERGNTTRTDSIVDDMPRGVGLDLLKEFVALNKGKLEIYTNDCLAFVDAQGNYDIKQLDFDFPGTLALITINCSQEVFYSYNDEAPNYF